MVLFTSVHKRPINSYHDEMHIHYIGCIINNDLLRELSKLITCENRMTETENAEYV